ncbi:hypothetical protein H4R33_005944, partial [Dimargaris cristalligena]
MTTLAVAGVGQLNTKAYPVSTPDSPEPETAVDNTSVSRSSNALTVKPVVPALWGALYPLTEEQPGTKCEAISQALYNVLDAPKSFLNALKKGKTGFTKKSRRQQDSEY